MSAKKTKLPVWLKLFSNSDWAAQEDRIRLTHELAEILAKHKHVVILRNGEPVRLSYDDDQEKIVVEDIQNAKYAF